MFENQQKRTKSIPCSISGKVWLSFTTTRFHLIFGPNIQHNDDSIAERPILGKGKAQFGAFLATFSGFNAAEYH